MAGRHERFQGRKFPEHRGGAGQLELQLLLNALEFMDRCGSAISDLIGNCGLDRLDE